MRVVYLFARGIVYSTLSGRFLANVFYLLIVLVLLTECDLNNSRSSFEFASYCFYSSVLCISLKELYKSSVPTMTPTMTIIIPAISNTLTNRGSNSDPYSLTDGSSIVKTLTTSALCSSTLTSKSESTSSSVPCVNERKILS